MKLLTLSDDLVNLIDKLLSNMSLAKMVFYTNSNPLNQPNFNIVEIAPFGKYEGILPHPFDIDYTEDVRSQLHIYFPRLEFENNEIVEDAMVFFDIVVHNSIWTIRDEKGKKKIRPYEIARELIYELKNSCTFNTLSHLSVNSQFQCLRIEGQIINWNDKHASRY